MVSVPEASQVTLVVVENTTHDNSGYDATAKLVLGNYKLAATVDELITLVNNQYAANNNNPIGLVLVAHAQDSAQSVGAGEVLFVPNQHLQHDNGEVQKFTQACRGKISVMFLLGCNIAQTLDTFQTHLMRSLSAGLSTPDVSAVTTAYDQEVVDTTAGLIGTNGRPPYFAVDVHAKKRLCQNGVPIPP